MDLLEQELATGKDLKLTAIFLGFWSL